jgi:hypothetical protein
MICPKFSPFQLYSLLNEKSLIFTCKLIFWGASKVSAFSYFSCDGPILNAEKRGCRKELVGLPSLSHIYHNLKTWMPKHIQLWVWYFLFISKVMIKV